MRLDPINLYDYEARAKQILPHNNWEFIEAGSMDEITTARNRSAFESLTLRPRFMRDTTERKIATTVLGQNISFPVMIAPTGGHGNAHPEAECATARGAGMSNTLMMCSTSSNCSLEEISDAASGPLWFQLYHRGYDSHRRPGQARRGRRLPGHRSHRRYSGAQSQGTGRSQPLSATRRAWQLPRAAGSPVRSQRHRRIPNLGNAPVAAAYLAGTRLAAQSHQPAHRAEGRPRRRGRAPGR